MPCYHPLTAYKSRHVLPSGKRAVTFSLRDGFRDLEVKIPCGQCIGCRLERSRQWAVRCMHEASLYEDNCFVTLTYNDASLPAFGSLQKVDLQNFMKRLRKRFDGTTIRFFSCGEYGDQFNRPHYHSLLFGVDFRDKTALATRGGFPVWRSPTLEKLWTFGYSEIGSVTFESAAYVARYITKKVTGNELLKKARYEVVDVATGEVARRSPEFALMSRGGRGGKGGIGKPWLEKYGCEVFPADSVVMRGRLMKPPRYYDGLYEYVSPEEMEAVKRKRIRERNRKEERAERLSAREAVELARCKLYGRRELSQ